MRFSVGLCWSQKNPAKDTHQTYLNKGLANILWSLTRLFTEFAQGVLQQPSKTSETTRVMSSKEKETPL